MTELRLAFDALPTLSQVVEKHGLAAKKSLGQNFLFDLSLTCKIARFVPNRDKGSVIEIGPGPGGLTRGLLYEGATQVIAIERDERCLPALAQISEHYPGRLQVVEADALACDLTSLGKTPRHVAANLPYNIGTELLVRWLQQVCQNPGCFASFTLMFQREVALRITAQQGDKHYGRLAVLANWLCHTEKLFDIAPGAFHPPPKVTSSVVSLLPRAQPLVPVALSSLEKVTAAAFGQRRKMLRQSLKTISADPQALCAAAGVDPTARAETLSIAEFCALAQQL